MVKHAYPCAVLLSRRWLTAALCAAALLVVLPVPAQAEDAVPPAGTTAASPSEDPPTDAESTDPASITAVPPTDDLPLGHDSRGDRVHEAQIRLEWLGYDIDAAELADQRMGHTTVAAVRRFQLKFASRLSSTLGAGGLRLLDRVAGTIGALPRACRSGTTVCIDKQQRLLRYVVDGDVRMTTDARFGIEGSETREGSFGIQRKSRRHVSSLYRTRMPFSMFFSGGQAIHYSPYFRRDGYFGASHGCINLRDRARAEWLFEHVPLGTRVHIYRSA